MVTPGHEVSFLPSPKRNLRGNQSRYLPHRRRTVHIDSILDADLASDVAVVESCATEVFTGRLADNWQTFAGHSPRLPRPGSVRRFRYPMLPGDTLQTFL